jgi:hypothetical protein
MKLKKEATKPTAPEFSDMDEWDFELKRFIADSGDKEYIEPIGKCSKCGQRAPGRRIGFACWCGGTITYAGE